MTAVLVVGAGPRLGGAIARCFGRAGYDIALISEDEASVTALGEALRGEGFVTNWAIANVVDHDDLSRAIAALAEMAGGIGVAIHNVSVWRETNGLTLSPDELLADVRAGAASLLTIAQACAPRMVAAGGGTIIATGSAAADKPSRGAPSLGVQKGALRALVQGIAPDLAEHGIHCATITINGTLGSGPAFEPDRIAQVYLELANEPRDQWRTVVPYDG